MVVRRMQRSMHHARRAVSAATVIDVATSTRLGLRTKLIFDALDDKSGACQPWKAAPRMTAILGHCHASDLNS